MTSETRINFFCNTKKKVIWSLHENHQSSSSFNHHSNFASLKKAMIHSWEKSINSRLVDFRAQIFFYHRPCAWLTINNPENWLCRSHQPDPPTNNKSPPDELEYNLAIHGISTHQWDEHIHPMLQANREHLTIKFMQLIAHPYSNKADHKQLLIRSRNINRLNEIIQTMTQQGIIVRKIRIQNISPTQIDYYRNNPAPSCNRAIILGCETDESITQCEAYLNTMKIPNCKYKWYKRRRKRQWRIELIFYFCHKLGHKQVCIGSSRMLELDKCAWYTWITCEFHLIWAIGNIYIIWFTYM